jgi:hypothetical protein
MEVVGKLRTETLRGAEKVTALWRQSLGAKVAVALSALLLAVLAFVLMAALARPQAGFTGSTAPQQVSGVFADVNGDGLVDYIVKAEVIVNKGPLGP